MIEPWQQPARALPIPAPPVAKETTASYIRRLARANGLDTRILLRHLGQGSSTPSRPSGRTAQHQPTAADQHLDPYDVVLNDPAFDRLAQISGYATGQLLATLTMPPDTMPATSQPRWRFKKLQAIDNARLACTHCTKARGMNGPVIVRLPVQHTICLVHARWIADPPYPIYPHTQEEQVQIPLRTLPELLDAARLHRRLARRHTPSAALTAFHEAHNCVSLVSPSPAHAELPARWEDRRRRLAHASAPALTLTHLTRCPETVICASILLSPYWTEAARRFHAGEDHSRPDSEDFAAELRRRLSLTDDLYLLTSNISVYARHHVWRHQSGEIDQIEWDYEPEPSPDLSDPPQASSPAWIKSGEN
ncbi:hypothetical protein Pth03_44180 [Planotetraspora thailandica]|uniref:TniQ domain-containing protein n=1 Tax=Planotetraspora thailandica TaxID=487172 RepID=A0A8J3XX10_9ACTN|nr:TniQ family protein [Planotetraspora thailandica]GII56029.1 hypothetical protein Pth03_44180 [Planotetraspora thailandica]